MGGTAVPAVTYSTISLHAAVQETNPIKIVLERHCWLVQQCEFNLLLTPSAAVQNSITMRTASDVLALIERWYQDILTAYNLQLYARNACELEDYPGTLEAIRNFIVVDNQSENEFSYWHFLQTIPVTKNRSLTYAYSRVADGADDDSIELMQEMADIWRQYMASPFYAKPPATS